MNNEICRAELFARERERLCTYAVTFMQGKVKYAHDQRRRQKKTCSSIRILVIKINTQWWIGLQQHGATFVYFVFSWLAFFLCPPPWEKRLALALINCWLICSVCTMRSALNYTTLLHLHLHCNGILRQMTCKYTYSNVERDKKAIDHWAGPRNSCTVKSG